MNGLVLWSCYAINLLHTSSSCFSESARRGNSITLPLPNLVAKLAMLLCSVFVRPLHCYTNSLPILSIMCLCVFHISCADAEHIFTCLGTAYAKWTPAFPRCSLCVHRLCSIDFIIFLFCFIFVYRVCVCVCVRVYHSACWFQPKPEMTVRTGQIFNFFLFLPKWSFYSDESVMTVPLTRADVSGRVVLWSLLVLLNAELVNG